MFEIIAESVLSKDAYGIEAWVLTIGALASAAFFQILGVALWQAGWAGTDKHGVKNEEKIPTLMIVFFQQVLGIGCSMILLLGLSIAGSFNATGVLLSMALVIFGAIFIRILKKQRYEKKSSLKLKKTIDLWEWLVLCCALIALGFSAWRFPGFWDDTSYHLPLARSIVENQSLVTSEWLRFPYFPAFMQLLFAAGLLLDASLAQWLAVWPVFVTLAGLMGTASWLGKHGLWGVLAWLFSVTTPSVSSILGFAYIDFGLTLFCTAALLAVAIWSQESRDGKIKWLLIAGFCAGVASGIKLLGLVFAAVVALGIIGMSWNARAAMRNLWIYGSSCVAVCAFWYMRSYWVTGDPVHPAGGEIFGYYLWTAQDLAAQAAEQANHGVVKKWIYFPQSLIHAKSAYLLGAIFFPVFFRQGRQKTFLLFWCVILLMVLFWFWISQVERYLMPVLPLGALMALFFLKNAVDWFVHHLKGSFGGMFPALIAIGLLTAYVSKSGYDLARRPSVVDQVKSRDEIGLLNTASKMEEEYGSKVLNFGYENAFFYYKGKLIGDWFGPASFLKVSNCTKACELHSIEEVERMMKQVGAKMLLIHSERFIFNEKQYSERMVLIEKKGIGYLYALRAEN